MIDSPPAEYRKRPPDGISREQELAVAEKVFRGLLCWFSDFREFIVEELGQTELCGPHEPPGRAPLGPRPVALWPPREVSGFLPKLPGSLMSRKKSPKSFVAFGLRLVLIFWKTKNRQKNSNWHWALS